MRRHTLRRAEIASSNLRMPLRRVSEAVFFRLRHFIFSDEKSTQAVARHATLLVSQYRIGIYARMWVLLRLRFAFVAPEQRTYQHDQHQGRQFGRASRP